MNNMRNLLFPSLMVVASLCGGCAIGQGSTSGLANGPVTFSLIGVRTAQEASQAQQSDGATLGAASTVTAPGNDTASLPDPAKILSAAQAQQGPRVPAYANQPPPTAPRPDRYAKPLALPAQRFHRIESKDNLFKLGQRYGVSVADLRKMNPGVDPDRLKVGTTLLIP
jgi:LysM repeat protein